MYFACSISYGTNKHTVIYHQTLWSSGFIYSFIGYSELNHDNAVSMEYLGYCLITKVDNTRLSNSGKTAMILISASKFF